MVKSLKYFKYHGLENDFVIFDIRNFDVNSSQIDIFRILFESTKCICDRQVGVGADGIIIVTSTYLQQAVDSKAKKYTENDNILCTMRIINSDGTEAEMCGNGIRCLASYLYHQCHSGDPDYMSTGGSNICSIFDILTVTGRIMTCEMKGENLELVRVNMGCPSILPADIPLCVALYEQDYDQSSTSTNTGVIANTMNIPTELLAGLEMNDQVGDNANPVHKLTYSCVSMGNPHTVLFLNQCPQAPKKELDGCVWLNDCPWEWWTSNSNISEISMNFARIGQYIENHPMFPQKTNVEIVRVSPAPAPIPGEAKRISNYPNHLEMVVWERGVGLTKACGTGACAVAYAAILNEIIPCSNGDCNVDSNFDCNNNVGKCVEVLITLPGGDLIIECASNGTIYMTGPAVFMESGTYYF